MNVLFCLLLVAGNFAIAATYTRGSHIFCTDHDVCSSPNYISCGTNKMLVYWKRVEKAGKFTIYYTCCYPPSQHCKSAPAKICSNNYVSKIYLEDGTNVTTHIPVNGCCMNGMYHDVNTNYDCYTTTTISVKDPHKITCQPKYTLSETEKVIDEYNRTALRFKCCKYTKWTEVQSNLKRSNKFATIPSWSKQWRVSFRIFPVKKLSGWTNVLHFTTGGNSGSNGERVPGVWFHSNSFRMHIRHSINNQGNAGVDTNELPGGQFSTVIIEQVQTGGKYYFQVFINEKRTHSVENKKVKEYQNVQVYLSDPWYTASSAYVDVQYHNIY